MKRIIIVGVVGFVVVGLAVGLLVMRALNEGCPGRESADAMFVQFHNEKIDIIDRQASLVTNRDFVLAPAEQQLKIQQLSKRNKEIGVLEDQLLEKITHCRDETPRHSGTSAAIIPAPVSSSVSESSFPDIQLLSSGLREGLTVGKCRGGVGRFTSSVTSTKHRYFEATGFEAKASVWNGEHFVDVPGAMVFGLDPVWWTSSERWIRCPQWPKHEAGERAGGSRMNSSSKPSG